MEKTLEPESIRTSDLHKLLHPDRTSEADSLRKANPARYMIWFMTTGFRSLKKRDPKWIHPEGGRRGLGCGGRRVVSNKTAGLHVQKEVLTR